MSALEEVLADAFGRMGVEMPTPLRRMNYWMPWTPMALTSPIPATACTWSI